MKMNRVAIILSIVGAVVIFALMVKGCASDSSDETGGSGSPGSSGRGADLARTEGGEATGDQTANSVRVLTAQYQDVLSTNEELSQRAKDAEAKVKQQQDAIEALTRKLDQVEGTANQANRQAGSVASHLGRYDDRLRDMVRQIRSSDDQPTSPPDGRSVVGTTGSTPPPRTTSSSYLLDPIVSRLGGSGGQEMATIDPNQRFVWFEPQATALGQSSNRSESVRAQRQEIAEEPVRKFTINPLATSFQATALTALVGRIPVNGTTPDPYRVKIIIGAENLAANGIYFDGVSGMIVGGWAKGDWNLSCVDVELDSYAFVFDDGTISAQGASSGSGQQNLGYVSMPNGFPCVPGEFHTNAPSYLAQTSFLNGLKAAGEAYAAKQTSQEDLPLGGSRTTVTGDTGQYVLGKVASGAVDDSIAWIEARQQNSFDAVVTPPGMEVVVHFEEQIEIDYDPNGRRVSHGTAQISGNFLD